MATLFPTGIPCLFQSGEPRRVFNGLRSGEESARLYAVRRWPASKVRGCEMRFLVTASERDQIRELWEVSKADGVAVDLRWPWSESHYGLWVCEYVNASLPYDLPIYGGSSHVFKNLVTGATIGGATVTAGTGANGRDRLTAWAVAPADGTMLGLNVTGYLELAVRLSGVWQPVELGQDAWQLTLVVDEV